MSAKENRISIIIDTLIDEKGLKGAEKAILKSKERLTRLGTSKTNLGDFRNVNKKQITQANKLLGIKKAQHKLEMDEKPFTMMGKQMEQLQKSGGFFGRLKTYFSSFRMEMLGVMFAGMQLQRVFGGLFKSMIENYKKIANANTPLSKSLTRLEASFMFLKFAIMEAIGPWLETFIGWIVDFVNVLSDNPELLEKIGKGIIGLAVAGTALFVLGQSALFVSSLYQAMSLLGELFVLGGIGWLLVAGLLALKDTGLSANMFDDFGLAMDGLKNIISGFFTGDSFKIKKGLDELKIGAIAAVWDFFVAIAGEIVLAGPRLNAILNALIDGLWATFIQSWKNKFTLQSKQANLGKTFSDSFAESLANFDNSEMNKAVEQAIKDSAFPQKWKDAVKNQIDISNPAGATKPMSNFEKWMADESVDTVIYPKISTVEADEKLLMTKALMNGDKNSITSAVNDIGIASTAQFSPEKGATYGDLNSVSTLINTTLIPDVQNFDNTIQSIKDKTVTITVKYQTEGSAPAGL